MLIEAATKKIVHNDALLIVELWRDHERLACIGTPGTTHDPIHSFRLVGNLVQCYLCKNLYDPSPFRKKYRNK
ncbi:MAG: hypothetical protein G01um101448_554 [Parcubacteria group bacterium Gr01-1014_48]|nr:MAG: hypothetical protein Greene041614_842 [Parcubacteria group bacterium Greene0416_14]TSC73782.1 MAG: hypothetical protein G01um101448_554 [Parcubacteria group bacterium Gr01-1014_48]TSD00649.1 MAG: hypothetical protein Greene101415_752 [Parcubacteria group bacterium Greene1014_15]TSD08085.1 MAG: hypothetical protein Greene07144_435 [Parcubacteria group bacterium Greene0714_4]